MHQGRGARGSETAEPSRELRRNVALEVSVCPADGARFEAVVTDISKEGCQLRTDAPLKAGNSVVLKHKKFLAPCQPKFAGPAQAASACNSRVRSSLSHDQLCRLRAPPSRRILQSSD